MSIRYTDTYTFHAFGTGSETETGSENVFVDAGSLVLAWAVQKHTRRAKVECCCCPRWEVSRFEGFILYGPGKETADAHQLQEDSVRAWRRG